VEQCEQRRAKLVGHKRTNGEQLQTGVQVDRENVARECAGKTEEERRSRLVAKGGGEAKVRREGRKVHQNRDHGKGMPDRGRWRSHPWCEGDERHANVNTER